MPTEIRRARCEGCGWNYTVPEPEPMLPALREHRTTCDQPVLLWTEPMLGGMEGFEEQLTFW